MNIQQKGINYTNQTHLCNSLKSTKCVDGTVLPAWMPITDVSLADQVIRSVVYLLVMSYFFLGVSIISDRFMAAIEMITSQERKYKIKKSNNVTEIVHVRIWNETVSNLTLMALGSSAPEILLSIIEICGKNFQAGELGPGTIVGSAAFNLFIIIGLCVMIIPNNEIRRTKHLLVFLVTSAWSIFAYIWMYLILSIISPGIVEVWEGVLTFLFFPLTVITAYVADTKIFFRGFLKKKILKNVSVKYQQDKKERLISDDAVNEILREVSFMDSGRFSVDSNMGIEHSRLEYMNIIKEYHYKFKDMGIDKLEKLAQIELFKRIPKSRAYYKMNALRSLIGGTTPMSNIYWPEGLEMEIEKNNNKQILIFTPCHYTIMENVGFVHITVSRYGPLINTTVAEVDFVTVDGTAKAGSDYKSKNGTIRFECTMNTCVLSVEIIDDDVYEEDSYFYVQLLKPRLVKSITALEIPLAVELGEIYKATVMIFDDDFGGTFEFEFPEIKIEESVGKLDLKVLRLAGVRGSVNIGYRYICDTAIVGKHFDCSGETISFKDGQTEEIIRIQIFNEYDYDKEVTFYVEFTDLTPNDLPEGSTRKAQLGKQNKIKIVITANNNLKKTIDHLIVKGQLQRVVRKSTWLQQIHEAFIIETDDDLVKGTVPPCSQYIMHYLTFIWKLLFSLVPPTDILNGWVCFTVAIIIIGILTAIIGDLASSFGCCIGLSDTVTAVTFVALGTSLPDTFASKVAAINDDTADSSIGNVMGSNAVNVFLGIGIAWSIASIYHAIKGNPFRVDSGSLGFSVTLFCGFAIVAITILLLRRLKCIGGELGGPRFYKYATGIAFFLIWLSYILISSLETYCHIKWKKVNLNFYKYILTFNGNSDINGSNFGMRLKL